MRGKEQVRETNFQSANSFRAMEGASRHYPVKKWFNLASGERGCVIEQTLQRIKGPRQQVGALVDQDGEKNVGRQRVVVQRRTGGLYR